MTRSVALNTETFVEIEYLVNLENATPKLVKGFAFEIPEWPEFHCCVRWGNRGGADLFDDWIIDHYESGRAIRAAGRCMNKEDAPAAMRHLLEGMKREEVHEALRRGGDTP